MKKQKKCIVKKCENKLWKYKTKESLEENRRTKIKKSLFERKKERKKEKKERKKERKKKQQQKLGLEERRESKILK